MILTNRQVSEKERQREERGEKEGKKERKKERLAFHVSLYFPLYLADCVHLNYSLKDSESCLFKQWLFYDYEYSFSNGKDIFHGFDCGKDSELNSRVW